MNVELLIAAAAGGFLSLVGYVLWEKYQKDAKARALRSIIKAAEAVKKMGDDGDAVETAKREAEEDALIKLASEAVKGIK